MTNNSIFISIASYRDKQLVPTILDCIKKCENPQNIFFGINWQRDETEDLSALKNIPNILIEEYDWKESKGACWSRHSIQKNLYDGQKFYLQLDSHHKFLENWDSHLFRLYNEAKQFSEKPLIGTYGTTFWPESNKELKNEPYRINTFESFGSDGDIVSRPIFIKNHQEINKKQNLIRARLLSGHFIFGDGNFATDCMYDPNFYFRGEEVSLSARAYTHGFDFFHPTYTVIWHEYLREKSNKHWTDHVKNNGFVQEGEDRNLISKRRQRKLFGIDQNDDIDFKQYGFGKERSLHDYELYAGLDFKNQRVHKCAYDPREEYLEPSIMSEADWRSGMLEKYEFDIQWSLDKIPDKNDYSSFFFGFETKEGKLLYRKDIKETKYLKRLSNKIKSTIYAEEKPDRCVIIPFSKSTGWTNKILISL
jgi:hypothetical protein